MASLQKATDEEVLACPSPPLIKPRSQSILPQWLLTKDAASKTTARGVLPANSKPHRTDRAGRSRPILSFLKKKQEEHHITQLLSYRSV